MQTTFPNLMTQHFRTRMVVKFVIVLIVHFADSVGPVKAADPLDYQRDVRPILANRCFPCHGFDEDTRQSGLRLDRFDGATSPADSHEIAIVPFRPEESELWRRIVSDDPAYRMPPEESGPALTAAEIETLRNWIADGANYVEHWAFRPPVSHPLPEIRDRAWPRNFIDHFILAALEQQAWQPREGADPSRLLRRVSLDLTGLPPTPAELDHFLAAWRNDPHHAYEAEVERLLSSPHLGERLALDWLDSARFADTNGYFGDRPRQAWPWRDWVIRAFNDNMPFDQFTIEQLAGDLLPEATREQRIATGFHRNSMANNETGIIDEEYRVESVADRVETTGTVWLGMTIGCAQCHDHKFDPISQREYYQLFAYFNQSVESGLITRDDPPPALEVPTPSQSANLEHARSVLQEVDAARQAQAGVLANEMRDWESTAEAQLSPLPTDSLAHFAFEPPASSTQDDSVEDSKTNGESPEPVISEGPGANSTPVHDHAGGNGPQRIVGVPPGHEPGISGQAAKFDASQHVELEGPFALDRPWSASIWFRPSSSLGCIWSKIEPTDTRRGVELIWQKGRLQLHLVHRWGANEIILNTRDVLPSGTWHHALITYDGSKSAAGIRMVLNGRAAAVSVHRDTLTGSIECAEPWRLGRRDSGLGYYGLLDEFHFLPRAILAEQSIGWSDNARLRGIFQRPSQDRSTSDQEFLRNYFVTHHAAPELRELEERWQRARAAEKQARDVIPSTLVMEERREPRVTHVLTRGEYNRPTEMVEPGVPAIFPEVSPDFPPNRLALARWLVSGQHPLTARVIVNRYWQICFGEGLVRTPGDFGIQGELPTHPQLLDELAIRFVDGGWNVKDLLRWIVTSTTYRQSSQATEELLRQDPENRWLARGPRFRLPAELIRDQALAASGLLATTIGGPSVKPYQPDGLWEEVSYNAEDSYVPDKGEGLWRRSLYTYWKRQAPPPAMLLFDAPTREKCMAQRSRTNTPLQALVLLNDTTYVEAARELAERTLEEPVGPDSFAERAGESRPLQIPSPLGELSAEQDQATWDEQDQRRLRSMFRRAVSRWPNPDELRVLAELLRHQRASIVVTPGSGDPGAPRNWPNFAGDADRDQELAAWTWVAQTILNLDEVMTRR